MARVNYPRIIQGGMGVGVSSWQLANAVSRAGQLGVVSGSMIDTVLVRRLNDGDQGGHLRRAIAHFPIPGVGDDVLRQYYRPRGRRSGTPYRALPMYKQRVSLAREHVTILANFVEVWLAKEGHTGSVGINLLTKVQMPNLASLFGAMLAGVDYVIMGAGIPREIPGVLDAFVEHRSARLRFDVEGVPREEPEYLTFEPSAHMPAPATPLVRPRFLAVVSAATLAATLARKSNGLVDGFIVEGATAGGHNAPPRGALRLNEKGEPIYGERDTVNFAEMRALGIPFWLAGGMGSPSGLQHAREVGAEGIQVGTLFAYTEESGIDAAVKRHVVDAVIDGTASVFTDPRASPTGYPFKVVSFPDDARAQLDARTRVCDLGYLRTPVRVANGRLVYRCPAEPVDAFVAKGGNAADAEGRRCLCNGLTATIGLAQHRAGEPAEPSLVTSGDDLVLLDRFLRGRRSYSAADVIAYLTPPA